MQLMPSPVRFLMLFTRFANPALDRRRRPRWLHRRA